MHQCSYCKKGFAKETTLEVHVCEPKRRYRERDEVGVRLGLQAYLRFYEIAQRSAKLKTFDDFAASAYYRGFVKFGRYCEETRVINFAQFTEWLIKHNIKIDHWCKDKSYSDYLLQHVQREAVTDALTRAIETALAWQERTGNTSSDYLRFGNDNAICHDITRGRVTAWAIYNCASGQEFLARINSEQVAMIWLWIDTDTWQTCFQDHQADQTYAQELLQQAGW